MQVRAHIPVPPADPGLQISVPISIPPSSRSFEDGGHLKHFSPFWRDVLGCTQYVLEAVEGFRPHFTYPASFPAGRGLLHPLSGQEQFLHRPRGGSPAPQGGHRGGSTLASASQLYQLHLSRPEEVWRNVSHFELKRLNAAHLNTPYFRIETAEDVHHALKPGDWVASIDLRDAYFHVPLHPSTKKYMSFGWRGRLYRFCVLPFGISPAPKVFTALTKFIKVHSQLGHWGRGGHSPPVFCLLS
jgi:hypothetical protein